MEECTFLCCCSCCCPCCCCSVVALAIILNTFRIDFWLGKNYDPGMRPLPRRHCGLTQWSLFMHLFCWHFCTQIFFGLMQPTRLPSGTWHKYDFFLSCPTIIALISFLHILRLTFICRQWEREYKQIVNFRRIFLSGGRANNAAHTHKMSHLNIFLALLRSVNSQERFCTI